jgi:hypothetical protein
MAAGFREISLGVESGCDTTLTSLGKNFTVEDIARAGAIVRKTRIPTVWYLLLGAPGETRATIAQTFRTIGKAAGPFDFVNIGVGLRVYNGSPIARNWKGPVPADHFLRPVAYAPEGLDVATIKRLAIWEVACRHNFIMFDDGANIMLLFRLFFTFFFPGQPIWRGYIAMRLLERITPAWPIRLLLSRPPRPRLPASSSAAKQNQ